MSLEKVETFQNPLGFWKYEGAFFVELAERVTVSRLPHSVTVTGGGIIVPEGVVTSSVRGIQMYFCGTALFLGQRFVQAVYTQGGAPIWINPKCKQ